MLTSLYDVLTDLNFVRLLVLFDSYLVFGQCNDISCMHMLYYASGLPVALFGAGLQTSEHFSWKGAYKSLNW